MFKHTSFPIENRQAFGELQSNDAVRKHLQRYKSEPYHERLSDFHLLMYLADMFDMQTAEAVCECVREGRPVHEGVTLMLDAVMAS